MIIRFQSADLFTSDVILQCHNFTSQHVRQRHDVIFRKKLLKFLPGAFAQFIYVFCVGSFLTFFVMTSSAIVFNHF